MDVGFALNSLSVSEDNGRVDIEILKLGLASVTTEINITIDYNITGKL